MKSEENRARYMEAIELQSVNRNQEAADRFQAILDEEPDSLDAARGLAMVNMSLGKGEKARELILRVAAAAPDRVDIQINLADILHILGDDEGAARAIERVRTLSPGDPMAEFLTGRVLWRKGEHKEALACFDRAISRHPAIGDLFSSWRLDRMFECAWAGHELLTPFMLARVRAGRDICHPLTLAMLEDAPKDLFLAARTFSRRYPLLGWLWQGQTWTHEKLRVGYMTGDLHDHPLANLISPVLENHDRAQVESTVFYIGAAKPHPNKDRVIAAADRYVDISGLADHAAAECIFEHEIDILVTLGGQTIGARPNILAWRPAPVQVSYMGYPATLGTPYIDYLIADQNVIAADEIHFYTEKIAWLPNSYQAAVQPKVGASSISRKDCGLPDDAFVFAALVKQYKITPRVFDVWMRVVDQVEGSVLWLGEMPEIARDNLRCEALMRGVDPVRLIFAERTEKHADHLGRQRLADLFLDTFPYTAHTTATDALWVGLPVITCRGATFPSRVCASLLKIAGLGDMACKTLEEYEALAVDLATNPSRLAEVRERVAQARSSVLFDTPGYVRGLEVAFMEMHARSRAGRRPESFVVDPLTEGLVSG